MGIRDWSTTASSNNAAAPNGFPEGMAPSGVNNAARELMAQVRGFYEEPHWIDYGDDPTRTGNTTFTVSGDLTARYMPKMTIRAKGSATSQHSIVSASYSDPSTTITVNGPNLPATLTYIEALHEPHNVRRFGAILDGSTDDSTAIDLADDLGVKIELPAGVSAKYASSTTLTNLAKVDLGIGAKFVGYGDDSDITARDRDDSFIGLHHNYNETKKDSPGPTAAITTGNFVSPPISKASGTDIDVLAYWYNDFGLDSTRQANGSLGNVKWYTWEWNHSDSTETDGYEADRHPMLGYYRGDDPVVLDWICYWLKEAGVNAVILIGRSYDWSDDWSSAADELHWQYQLFNNTPNFKGLKYVMGLPYNLGYSYPALSDLQNEFDDISAKVMEVHDNIYTIDVNGKDYPLFFIWDDGEVRGLTDNYSGATNMEAYFTYIASAMQALGYGGAAFLSRNATTTVDNTNGVENGWVHISGDYSRVYGVDHGTTTTYSDIVDDFNATPVTTYDYIIPSIMCSRDSHSAHPTTWTETGHTPALFTKLVNKCANLIRSNKALFPNAMTIYNVSEWAEGGPGLIPNMQDGWGYLDAIRKGIGSGTRAKILSNVGEYTGSLTGTSDGGSGTIKYRIDYERGLVHVMVPSQILGTSNTTAATITGMPANIRPESTQVVGGVMCRDNGSDKASFVSIATSGVITLYNAASTTFTNSGSKGLRPCQFTYQFRDEI